jgi:GTPase SAR1 family protein
MSALQKLIIVGEPGTGKTSLIRQFLAYNKDGKGTTNNIKQNDDFSLKMIYINGEKVRIQLWDQGSSKDPQSTFHPLFTRHCAGCIIVANTLNLQSIKK